MSNVFPVVILCASPSKVRDILLKAEELNMMEKGEYVFFNVDLFERSGGERIEARDTFALPFQLSLSRVIYNEVS